MIRFATSRLGAMVLAIGLTAMAVAPADARGRHGGCCGGGYYGGCCGGGWYGGCCGGGWYGGWGYGCCGGGYYGGWGYGGWGGGMYRGGSGSRIDYYGPYMAYQSMPYEQRSYYYSPSSGNGNGSSSPATIQIQVPRPDAQVWFGDYLTRQTGQTRTFQTPALSADSDATYTVRVRWNDKGQPMEQTKQVVVRGGKQAQLDFTGENLPGADSEKATRDRDRGTEKEKGSPQKERGSPGK